MSEYRAFMARDADAACCRAKREIESAMIRE